MERLTIRLLLLVITLVWTVTDVWAFQTDTFKTEIIDGKRYVMHQVNAKETVYSLSRKYNVPVPEILKHNPQVEQVLSVGQIVKVPVAIKKEVKELDTGTVHRVKEKETLYSISKLYGVSVKHLKQWNNIEDNTLHIGDELVIRKTDQKSAEQEIKDPSIDLTGKKMHKVLEKETLYSISKQYGVEVDEIVVWNKLESNAIQLGQLLIVGKEKPVSNQIEAVTTEADSIQENGNSDKKEAAEEVFRDGEPRVVKNANGFDEIIQTGLAELIEGSEETRKYLALHRTAKIGTIMKVRNEMNNKMVFVRVLGRIPHTGDNDKLLIKLSKAAYDRLGVLDKRFRVEVSYMP